MAAANQPAIRQELTDSIEAMDVVDLVQQRHRDDPADSGDRLQAEEVLWISMPQSASNSRSRNAYFDKSTSTMLFASMVTNQRPSGETCLGSSGTSHDVCGIGFLVAVSHTNVSFSASE